MVNPDNKLSNEQVGFLKENFNISDFDTLSNEKCREIYDKVRNILCYEILKSEEIKNHPDDLSSLSELGKVADSIVTYMEHQYLEKIFTVVVMDTNREHEEDNEDDEDYEPSDGELAILKQFYNIDDVDALSDEEMEKLWTRFLFLVSHEYSKAEKAQVNANNFIGILDGIASYLRDQYRNRW